MNQVQVFFIIMEFIKMGTQVRLRNVVNIIQSYSKNFSQGNLDPKKLNIIAIIPSKGPLKKMVRTF